MPTCSCHQRCHDLRHAPCRPLSSNKRIKVGPPCTQDSVSNARRLCFSSSTFLPLSSCPVRRRCPTRARARPALQVGLKMFLGVTASVTNWNQEGTECSLVGETYTTASPSPFPVVSHGFGGWQRKPPTNATPGSAHTPTQKISRGSGSTRMPLLNGQPPLTQPHRRDHVGLWRSLGGTQAYAVASPTVISPVLSESVPGHSAMARGLQGKRFPLLLAECWRTLSRCPRSVSGASHRDDCWLGDYRFKAGKVVLDQPWVQ
jgi:hypothetical protein